MNDFVENAGGILVPASLGNVKFGGVFSGEIIRGGYFDDNGLWHRGKNVIDRFEEHNLVVNEGLNDILSVAFNGGSAKANWYLGLFEANYTPLATDTAANIATNSTETTAYASSTRPAWTPAAPSSQQITNSASKASFVFNASKTIYGGFLVSNSVKSGTGGVLWSAARFTNSKAVGNLDELLLTYTFTASTV